MDGEAGAYGVTFPDLAGCTAMGATLDEARRNATEALRDGVEVTQARGGKVPDPRPPEALWKDRAQIGENLAGAFPTFVTLIRNSGRPVKANLSLDSGVLAAIDATAERLGVTRSGMVEMLAGRSLPELA